MNILVTGATGFTGVHLIKYLTSLDNIEITCLTRHKIPSNNDIPKISWVKADLLKRDQLFYVISDVKPDYVFHLAGLNQGSLVDLLAINVVGTKNILDAVYKTNSECHCLVISSSMVYGYSGLISIPEETVLRPLSEYAVSKAAQEHFSIFHHTINETQITVARSFNLIGPNQNVSSVCGRIIQQVTEIEQGKRNVIDLFETSSSRDFIDVRDAVMGYWALLSHPEFEHVCAGQVFNIGSGKAFSILEIINLIEKITGEHYRVRLPEISIPIPILYQQSDNSRIHAATGWKPIIPLQNSLRDMLEVARKKDMDMTL
jgi:GDP-4-dehydro-6-deoxy-D-mannose reductase